MSPVMARFDGVREFFVLADAEARSAKLPIEVRQAIARDVTIARQKREAAEVLWLGGSPAEALGLAHAAFELIAAATSRAHDQGSSKALPPSVDALRSKLDARGLAASTPLLDSDVVDADTATFFALLTTHDELRRLVVEASLSKPELVQKRRSRLAWAIAIGLFSLVAVVYLVRTPRVLRAEASGIYDEVHGAAKAVDGRIETEFLLPNGQPGWIDFTVVPARKLKRIKLLDGHNPPFNDRQTQDYRLEVFGVGGKLLKSIDGTFGDFNEAPTQVPVELDVSDKIERIRLEIKTFHKMGAALAEVEVE